MHIYYNQESFDTLVIELSKELPTHIKRLGDVVCLYRDEVMIGINILDASMHIEGLKQGLIHLSVAMRSQIQAVLEVHQIKLNFDDSHHFVIGEVLSKEPVEGSEKLNICQVSIDVEQLQIVCGAKNVAVGQKVVVAKVGARMPSGLYIEASSLKGVASNGMICSKKELAVINDLNDEGIMVLPSNAIVGQVFER